MRSVVTLVTSENFFFLVCMERACLTSMLSCCSGQSISYDKGTPFARTVRKAKDLTSRQPGRRKGIGKADNLYDHGVVA